MTTSGCTYDAAGNMTTDCSGGHSYQWDAEGRMSSVDSGNTWGFTYNALGHRVQWSYSNGAGADEQMFDPNGGWLGTYGAYDILRWGDGYYALYNGSDTNFGHFNNLGSTAMLTNHAGTPVEDVLFYPWGQNWQTWGSGGYNFAELPYYDTTTNTNIAMFRSQSPGLGRWHSPDPVGGYITNPQSLNRYAYVMNNPTTSVDPTGLCGEIYYFNNFDSNGNLIYGSAPVYGEPCPPEEQSQSNQGEAGGGNGPLDDLFTLPPSLMLGSGLLQSLSPNVSYYPPTQDRCTQPVLGAVNQSLDSNFTSSDVQSTFENGGATNLNIQGNGLPAAQFNAIQPGRYPLNWWTYIVGWGPTTHVTGHSPLNQQAVFTNSNNVSPISGLPATSVTFTAHTDSAYLYNPIGALLHLLVDVLQAFGSRNPCPP